MCHKKTQQALKKEKQYHTVLHSVATKIVPHKGRNYWTTNSRNKGMQPLNKR